MLPPISIQLPRISLDFAAASSPPPNTPSTSTPPPEPTFTVPTRHTLSIALQLFTYQFLQLHISWISHPDLQYAYPSSAVTAPEKGAAGVAVAVAPVSASVAPPSYRSSLSLARLSSDFGNYLPAMAAAAVPARLVFNRSAAPLEVGFAGAGL